MNDKFNINDGSVTRKTLVEHLQEQGLTGPALDMILKDTAKARHEWRVEQTIEAAKTWAIGVLGEDGGRACIHALACALLVADLRGPDPYWWVDRRCTIRHPALSSLGKGRVRASDGDAYIAAATEALEQLSSLYQGTAKHVIFEAKDGVVRVAIADIKPPVPYATINPADIGPIWAMTIAREGLRRAAGLNPVLLSDVKVYFDYRGGIEEWGRAVNGIVAAILADDLASCSLIDQPPFEPGPDGNHRIMIQTAYTRDAYQVYFLREESGDLKFNSHTCLTWQEQLGDDRWAQVVQAWEDMVNGRQVKGGGRW